MFDRDGYASTAALYEDLEPSQRRFVDQFLASAGVRDQLSFRLSGNDTTDGYLTLHEPTVISATRQRQLAPLVPALTRRLQKMLPVGLPGALSSREREAVELVAFGLTNEEIASVLNVRPDTVKKHLFRAMHKLGIRRRSALAVAWTTGRRLPAVLAQPGRGHPQPSPS
jgi:DNA-binding CsgD family transcriptional regulator